MKRELMKQEVEIIREEAVGLLADETTWTSPEEARQRAISAKRCSSLGTHFDEFRESLTLKFNFEDFNEKIEFSAS